MKNCGCAKGNPSGKNHFRGQLLRFLLHRHLGTGDSRNRIRHKLKFKKPPWFERTTAKNTQMLMREHKICRRWWTPTLSKAHSGAADPNPSALWEKSIWCYSSAQDHEETLLPNPGNIPTQHRLFHTVWKVPGEHQWGGRSCSWFGTKSKNAPGTDHGMCHRVPGHWPEALGNQVRGIWNGSNHANSKL